MRAYVTIVDGFMDLLPYYVNWYVKIGVTRFFLLVYGTGDDVVRATRILGDRCEECAQFPADVFIARHRDQFIERVHVPGEWATFADLDEFPQTNGRLLQELCEGVDYISGTWVDRLAPKARFIDVAVGKPLEDQFPFTKNMSRLFNGPRKCFIASTFAPYNHHPREHSLNLPVHHFKWQRNVFDRIRKRISRIERHAPEVKGWASRNKRLYKAMNRPIPTSDLKFIGRACDPDEGLSVYVN